MEPWQTRLAHGDPQGAWDLFAERYGRLILSTIRRLVPVHDDVMDVYSTVCQALSADGCARLRRYSGETGRRASVATWVVVVVRNRTVDWLRQEEGRRRVSVPEGLTPLQQAIYRAVCIDGCSHVEAYELVRTRTPSTLSFAAFLREVRATHGLAPCPSVAQSHRTPTAPLTEELAAPAFDPAETSDLAHRLAEAMAMHPPDVRLAVELFVTERVSAADVARAVGWPNAKAVYNRVYRALDTMRALLVREGIGPGDL